MQKLLFNVLQKLSSHPLKKRNFYFHIESNLFIIKNFNHNLKNKTN